MEQATPEISTPKQDPGPGGGPGLLRAFQSVERKLLAALLLIGVIPLFIMAIASYLQARSVLSDSVASEVESVASLTEDRVARWMLTREADAKTYSSIILSERGQDAVMEDILESTGSTYEAIYYTNNDGEVLFGVRQVVDENDGAISYQRDYNVGHAFEDEVFTPIRQANGDYFRSSVLYYNPFEVYTMFITHRVRDGGAGIGFIILQVSSSELQGLTEGFANGDGRAYLRVGDGLVSRDNIEILAANSGVKNADAGEGREDTEGFSGETVLGSWKANPDLGFVVFAQVSKENALSSINSLAVILAAVALGFLLLIGMASYLIARWITNPIQRLTSAARAISKGQLDTRVGDHLERRSDEIGELARAFDDMTENLRVRVYEANQNRSYLEDVLTSYMKFVERVSRGDLTARLSLNGQTGNNLIMANVRADQDDNLLRLGYNLNRMVEALHGMASQTRDVAQSLSEAAVQILDSSTTLISAATQQDAAVSQTTSTVTEVRATVAETAERAQMVAEAAQQSVEISRQGQHAVAETIEGMNVIRSRVESIAENILMLSERTTQIGDIIATVNAIADQSKMLALNASIEAARAGEEGRGFAVVAMEVRNLAEQSREATAQVRDILSEIQHATNTAVMVTEEGTKGVDLGVQLVDRAGRAIRELAGKLEEASQSAMQIAASTRQQSQGMDQLTAAMTSIKTSTSATSTNMQASQRNAKDLNEMARQMSSAISAYKL